MADSPTKPLSPLTPAAQNLLVSLVLVQLARPDPNPSATTIAQTYNLARLLQANSTALLNTYLSAQGSPFSDPGFSAVGLRWAGVPVAPLPFLAWRTMGDAERLTRSYGAYAAFDAFLQLVWDDQAELCPGCSELLAMLGAARARTRGLLANLTSIMATMGIPAPPAADSLSLEATGVGAFERKCRGYVVCREYQGWIDRTVRDFTLLKAKYPA
nr:cardiotrophin-2-like isoform X1 [Pelodiscus sinensis]XP_025046115.1 cardiotrophin-2-like isoform X2 [Pelodiscus sinensis]|eukprot:XP_025046113.1 cardiotrophin-2-like isoform X1 [Pelodiscus sinensis]